MHMQFFRIDGQTLVCEGCGTWQHLRCYYGSLVRIPDVHRCSNCSSTSAHVAKHAPFGQYQQQSFAPTKPGRIATDTSPASAKRSKSIVAGQPMSFVQNSQKVKNSDGDTVWLRGSTATGQASKTHIESLAVPHAVNSQPLSMQRPGDSTSVESTTTSTDTQQGRLKPRVECVAYLRAKVKCSKDEPSCVRCGNMGIFCQYSASMR